MKRIVSIGILSLLSVLLMGQMVVENKFTLKLYQWMGLDSDEQIATTLIGASDLWNVEIGREGNQIFLEQRGGTQWFGNPTGTEIKGLTLVQADGDSERVVVYMSNGNIYQTTGDGNWHDILPGAVTESHSTFLLFKDTLLWAGDGYMYYFGLASGKTPVSFDTVWNAGGSGYRDAAWTYNRLLEHQDRVYAYGTDDNNNNTIVWMPEFDIIFKTAHFDSQVALGYAGELQVGQDGEMLTNVLPLGNHIMAYKMRQIYKILIDPITNSPTEVILFAQNTGAYGYGSAVAWNNVHFFVAEDGVYENNGSSYRKISDAIEYWFEDSLLHSVGNAQVFKTAVYDNKLFVTLPKKSASAVGNVDDYRTFVYDIETGIWAKWKFATTNPNDGVAESNYMLRYEYNPNASSPLGGAKLLKQRLLFVRDSAGASTDDVFWMYPSDGYRSDGGKTFEAMYTTPLSPITDMWKRKALERVTVFGEAAVSASDSALSLWIVYRNNTGDIDSTEFRIGESPFLFNKRLPTTVTGDLLGFRMVMRDTNQIKVNAVELIGSEKGLGNETD